MAPEEGIEQAKVMLKYYEQKKLPEEQRDILKFRLRNGDIWRKASEYPAWNFDTLVFRLRKRPQKKTVTVYLYRCVDGNLYVAMRKPNGSILGQADITYEEPQNDS